ncbi:aspartate aminotransferase family protein [Streptomyces sp. NPDC059474]|uniref:aspartate aminotransferase family protein n=1 Tax=unclassified Streptomyces TaxID=2593676 RepID=UPI0033C24F3E
MTAAPSQHVTEEDSSAAATITERDAQVIAGVQKLRYFPLEVATGRGVILIEPGGRELIDLSATWTASGLGHGHPAVTEAIVAAAQAPPGASILSAVHEEAVAFAEELLALTPGPADRRVYLGHAGSDANDAALRACRARRGFRRIIAFENGYHGGTGVAMGVSGVQIDGGAVPDPYVTLVPYPTPFHAADGDAAADLVRSLSAVEQELSKGDVACLIVEPLLADGGLVVPPDGFLAGVSNLCRLYNTPLVCDEVKVGLGRTGLLHAFEHDGVTPDIMTFGKSLGAGLPLSAAVGPSDYLDEPVGSSLLTTAGNPICAAVGRTVLRILVEEQLPERAAAAGARFLVGLGEQLARYATFHGGHIGDLRGRGLAIGVEITNPGTQKPDASAAAAIARRAWELGVVVYVVGGNVLEITPPLVIDDAQIDRAVEVLAQAVSDVTGGT